MKGSVNKLTTKLSELSLKQAAFFQALALTIYCGLVGIVFWGGDEIFGKMSNYFGPLTFLVLLCFSALVSALLTLGYPFVLFWIDKKPKKALRLVIYTTLWLFLFLILLMVTLVIF